jgi:hypothetical protein
MKKYGLIILIFGASACLFYYAAWPQLDFHKNLLSSVQSSLAGQLEVEMYTLDQYNSTNVHKIDVPRIKKFLDDQIVDFGLDPRQFYYVVGDKWFAKKVSSNSYELIIPSNISSLADTHKMFFGLNYAPQHAYNIDDLDAALKNGDHKRLARYRVEIIKALVGLKIQTIPAVVGTILGATATATVLATTLGLVREKIDQNLAYFLQGLHALYNQVSGMQDEEALQIDIDRYILKTIDIDLIEARIAELEELVLAQQGSLAGRATAWAARMLLQSGETTYLEKRLTLLKEYLKENDLELRLYQQIKQKSLLKGKKI